MSFSEEIILHCPKCEAHDTPKLYINLEKQVFNCFRCNWHGKIRELYKFPKLVSSLENQLSLAEFAKLKSFKPLDCSNLDVMEDLNPVRELFYEDPQYTYLLNRGWTDDLISLYKPLLSLNPKYKDRVIIPVVKNDKIIYWTARSIIANPVLKYKNPSMPRNNIIFEASIPENRFFLDTLVICEGIFDAFKIPQAISLFGKTITTENELNIIKKASNKDYIFVALDEGAENCMENICKKLYSWFPNKKIRFIDTTKYQNEDLGKMSERLTPFELLHWIQDNSKLYVPESLTSSLKAKLTRFI